MVGSTVNTISTNISEARVLRRFIVPVLVAATALTVSVVGALALGQDSGSDAVNQFVEALSGNSQGFLGDLGILAPLGFALVAGAVAAVNPCGFAMLPAYMGLYLGDNEPERDVRFATLRQLGKAVMVGGSVTAGFVVLFGVAGTVIGLGARSFVADILPWVGLVIGIALTIVGAWMLGGGKLYYGFATRAASHMGNPGTINTKGYFLFGLSYGTASLSCTLPIFLSVVGTSFAVSSIATSFGQYILYSMGMGLVILSLTLGMALFKGAMVGGLRKALPYIQPVGTWMMIVAGSYIVFYWLTIGNILD
jgi:cytochrome c-type biogenesis protein